MTDEQSPCVRCHQPFYVEPQFDVPDHGMCWPCASRALDEAPTVEQIELLKDEVGAAVKSAAEVREHRDRLKLAVWAVIDTFEAAISASEARGRGGQQVPFHGDFASVGPSTIQQMRRWSRDLRDALKNKWPLTRDEFQYEYNGADGPELDRMFQEREP